MVKAPTKANSVQLATFLKWSVGDTIGYRVNNLETGRQMVTEVYCKVCAKFIDKILAVSTIRGQGHHAALSLQKLHSDTSPSGNISVSQDDTDSSSTCKHTQPRIDQAIHEQGRQAYRKLLKTAYLMAVGGQPLTTFATLVMVQKANGVKLIQSTDSSKKAREFVNFLAQAIRRKIAEVLCSAACFSVLSDGSQARKTGSEKELVLVKTVKAGVPVFLTAALQDIDVYGEANAGNIKESLDDVFKSKVIIETENYTKKVVAATSDGASVNTGVYSGLLTRLRNDGRPWLLTTHCVSHRIELAIKDSLLKLKSFEQVKDVMVNIYYLMKRSGKFQRHFKSTAEAMCVQVYKFPKVHGTRFVNHQRCGVKILLHNWIILMHALENSIANNSQRALSAKLRGILKKLVDFRFLAACCEFKAILDIVAKLSLKFEEGKLFVFEVIPAVETMKSEIQAYEEEQESSITAAGIDVNGDEISCVMPKAGHMRRSLDNRESVTIRYKGMKYPGQESQTGSHPANWIDDHSTAELPHLEALSGHFEATLALSGFDNTKLKHEWRNLKLTVKHYYQEVKAGNLWQNIFLYRRSEFKNVCLLAEIVLSIGVSNSTVEAGFSFLTAMLTDRRLSMNHETMEDLLVIKANHLVFTEMERSEIIESALDEFMQKRRKLQIDNAKFCELGVPPSKKRKTDGEEAGVSQHE
ncbi:zinc finger protein 862-like [Glandiceps talaboti]